MSQPHILIKNGLIIDGTGNDPFAGTCWCMTNVLLL